MATHGSFGGGRGFASFPSRKTNQLANDGRVTIKGNRRQRQKNRSSICFCEAEIYVPFDQRVPIFGRGGSIIKKIREGTNTTIIVPSIMDNNPNHPIRITGSGIENVLYTCWKISLILLENENEPFPCKIIEHRNNLLEYWTIIRWNNDGSFLVEERRHLSVYCIKLSDISAADTEILIDNICLIDTEIDANCDVRTIVTTEKGKKGVVSVGTVVVVVVIYGSPIQKPENLYNMLIAYKTNGEVPVAVTTKTTTSPTATASASASTAIIPIVDETKDNNNDSFPFPFRLDNYDFAIGDMVSNIIKEIKIPNL